MLFLPQLPIQQRLSKRETPAKYTVFTTNIELETVVLVLVSEAELAGTFFPPVSQSKVQPEKTIKIISEQ